MNATMAAHGEGRAGDVVDTTMPPSPPALPVSASDTPSAPPSAPSEVVFPRPAPSSHHPSTSAQPLDETLAQTDHDHGHHYDHYDHYDHNPDAFPDLEALPGKRPLPSPRNGRSFSLAHLSGPIKRKPLSSTASPAAIRFSKGAAVYADILADLPRPEQRFARSCSLDSPTLYEFPGERSPLPTTSSLNTVQDASSLPYVFVLLYCFHSVFRFCGSFLFAGWVVVGKGFVSLCCAQPDSAKLVVVAIMLCVISG